MTPWIWLAVAHATPVEVTHTGRLISPAGAPVEGATSLTVALYGAATGGAPIHTETVSVEVADGFFAVRLGAAGDLDHSELDAADLFVTVSVGGTPFGPRVPVTHAPWAAVAETSRAVSTPGTRITPDGTLILGAAGEGACSVPGAVGLHAASGTVRVCQGGSWRGIGNSPPAIASVTGPTDGELEPAATATLGVAAVDADLDTLSYAWTFVGASTGWTLTNATSATPTLTAPGPTGLASVTVRVSVSDGSTATTRDVPVALFAEASCLGYNVTGKNRGDGLYYISPSGTVASAFQARCVMSVHGGGWTTCLAVKNGNAAGTDGFAYTRTAWGSQQPVQGTAGNLCTLLPKTELYGESWATSSATTPQIRTNPVSIPSTAFNVGTFQAFSAGGHCVGLNHRSGMAPNQIGGLNCAR
jgi:hypothetical protein